MNEYVCKTEQWNIMQVVENNFLGSYEKIIEKQLQEFDSDKVTL
jgi:hypothetical protein